VFFSFSPVPWGQIFGVFFAPFPEEEISDYIAHGPIIRVLTVLYHTSDMLNLFEKSSKLSLKTSVEI